MPSRPVPLLVSWAFADPTVGMRIREQVNADIVLRTLVTRGSPLEVALGGDPDFRGWSDEDKDCALNQRF